MLTLDNISRTLQRASRAAVVERGNAGGTVALWAETPDGRVVCVTDTDGPFSPDFADVVRDIDGFLVGVYASRDAYLDGANPIGGLDAGLITVEPTLTALRDAITAALA